MQHHCKSLTEHLVEAEVEGFSKGKGLEGGQPEQHLEGEGQEDGVDEGGEDEGKDGKVKRCPSRPWLNDQGGQKDTEDNDHAGEEMDDEYFMEMDEISFKNYLMLKKTIVDSLLSNLIMPDANVKLISSLVPAGDFLNCVFVFALKTANYLLSIFSVISSIRS